MSGSSKTGTAGRRSEWKKGFVAGIPIGLGYLSVSFGFGILAMQAGLNVFQAVILSLTNLTSAGQAAGVAIIAEGGAFLETAITELVINLRYALMGLTLTQKIDESFHTKERLMVSYGITDEIFAMAASRDRKVTPQYMYGMIVVAVAGWTAGTFLGAAAGALLPSALTDALGIMLYGMFIAVCVPAGRKDRKVLRVMLIAITISCVIRYAFTAITSGFAVIISALAAASIGAVLFPLSDEAEAEQTPNGGDKS